MLAIKRIIHFPFFFCSYILTRVFAVQLQCHQIPLMNLMRGPKNIIVFLLLIIFTTAIVMATPAGFPYKENETPQRYYVFVSTHTLMIS